VLDESGADSFLKVLLELIAGLANLIAEIESSSVTHIFVVVGAVLQHFAEVGNTLIVVVKSRNHLTS